MGREPSRFVKAQQSCTTSAIATFSFLGKVAKQSISYCSLRKHFRGWIYVYSFDDWDLSHL